MGIVEILQIVQTAITVAQEASDLANKSGIVKELEAAFQKVRALGMVQIQSEHARIVDERKP